MSVLDERAEEREAWAEELLDRLTPIMSALGVLFLLVVLADVVARPGSALSTGLTVANWVLWAVFAAEFAARLVVAPSTSRFLRRNWWQLVFLVLPFLRFLRLVRVVRIARSGRVLSSAVRSSRSAQRLLGNRIAWLAVLTGIVILSSSQLLHQLGSYERYGDALHATTLAAVAGEPLASAEGWERLVEVGLVVFSVAVFATLAGALGAYFLRRR
ncbi:hypothetical protein [Nocardioides sp. SYSU DS0651]|uniref:hypothetical protein n=1 Tax=Nocardioides sp. SYSU DS0651 TaxID=3415955 RepID=UPI003F4B1EC1